MTPDLSRRLGSALGRHIVTPAERKAILRAATRADRWDDLPADIRQLVEQIEQRPGQGRLSADKRYSPDQPRVPEGSPAGGQFGATEPAKEKPPPRSTMAYNQKTGRGPGYGMKGGDPNVRQLQAALNRLGLTDAKGKALTIDGKLGPKTTQAIMAAQQRLGIEVTGKVTPTFFKKLVAAKALDDAKPKPAERPRKPRAAVAQVLRDLGFRHTPGGHHHNQLSHAGDLLGLAGRIELGDGESFISSGRVDLSDPFPEVLYAVVDTPKGQRVRVGIIPGEDAGKWRAGNKGGTADLDTDQIRRLRADLTAANDRAKASAKAADKQWNSGTPPTEPVLIGDEPVAEGRLETGWGDLTWSVWITDDDPAEWQTSMGVDVDSDNARLDPKDLRKLLAKLDELGGDAPRSAPQSTERAS